MNPYTLSIVILVVLLACAEVNSLRRVRNVRQYERTVKARKV